MSDAITSVPSLVIGLDVGDVRSHACVVDSTKRVVEEFSLPTTRAGFERKFRRPRCRIILEVGPHSRWLEKHLEELGHAVLVVDARKVELIAKSTHKSDRRDARTLAHLGAGVPELLGEVIHRSEQAQADLSVLLTRSRLVDLRTQCINRVRGVLKSWGVQVPALSSRAFHRKLAGLVPPLLEPALLPLLDELLSLNLRIVRLDDEIEAIAMRYPVCERLRKVGGVGLLTSLAFVLSIDDPSRFEKSRDVGPFVGLAPRKHASGESDPQLSITRCGNPFLRWLLVQSAHYVLGPFGPDCDLKQYGTKIHQRGGKCAKKRAVVAVARKLAVLLHQLWVDPTPYDPWYQLRRSGGTPPEPVQKLRRRKQPAAMPA